MMRFSAFAVLGLVALCALLPLSADAQQKQQAKSYLTRVGPYVGIKDVPVFGNSLEDTMIAIGVPDLCRSQAHDALRPVVAYGQDTLPKYNPKITILCAFETVSDGEAKGMMGKPLGKRGRVGGLRYIYFKNDINNVERFITEPAPKDKTSLLRNEYFIFATRGDNSRLPAMNAEFQCARTGTCGAPDILRTPVLATRIGHTVGARNSFTTSNGAQSSSNHSGTDLPAPCGAETVAGCTGRITQSGMAGGCGYMVRIACDNNWGVRYCHLQSQGLAAGTQVRQGQVIGLVGSTGNSTGCHAHYEVKTPSGQLVDATSLPTTPGAAAGYAPPGFSNTVASVDGAVAALPPPNLEWDGGGSFNTMRNNCMTGASIYRGADACGAVTPDAQEYVEAPPPPPAADPATNSGNVPGAGGSPTAPSGTLACSNGRPTSRNCTIIGDSLAVGVATPAYGGVGGCRNQGVEGQNAGTIAGRLSPQTVDWAVISAGTNPWPRTTCAGLEAQLVRIRQSVQATRVAWVSPVGVPCAVGIVNSVAARFGDPAPVSYTPASSTNVHPTSYTPMTQAALGALCR